MSAAYSEDLRRKVVEAYTQREGSMRTLAHRFKVSLGFVRDLLQRYRETGAVKPKVYRRGIKPKVDKAGEDYLQGLLLQVPELTRRELCVRYEEHVGLPVSTSTMDRTWRRLHLTRKKSNITTHKGPASGFSR